MIEPLTKIVMMGRSPWDPLLSGGTMGTPRTTGNTAGPALPPFQVICLLASAGGLEALQSFFRNVPRNPDMAFLVLQHFPVDQPSLLPELLGRHTALPCRMASSGEPVTPGLALILAPGMVLAWQDGQLVVAFQAEAQASLCSGDYLFQSAAACLGARALGVVLSGTGTDGTAGLQAIQDCGGRTFAQAPATATYDGMPRNAIEAGVVGWVLPAEALPAKLAELGGAQAEDAPHEQLEVLKHICAALARRTDNDFSRYKTGTLLRRINHRVQTTGTGSLREYLSFLEASPDEADALLKDLLIGVTEFFRDPAAFESLAGLFLPSLLGGQEDPGPLRIWVPGCCSGEEAYSLAMVVHEHLHRLGSARPVRIFATDLDTGSLMAAKAGRYGPDAVRNVSPDRLARYFAAEGSTFRVITELRDMCVFSVQNLVRDPPFSSLHLIACRNVFIYLQPTLQRKLVPLFHFALKPHGLLFLGSAEGLAAQPDLFEALDKANRIYRRREVQYRPAVEFQLRTGNVWS